MPDPTTGSSPPTSACRSSTSMSQSDYLLGHRRPAARTATRRQDRYRHYEMAGAAPRRRRTSSNFGRPQPDDIIEGGPAPCRSLSVQRGHRAAASRAGVLLRRGAAQNLDAWVRYRRQRRRTGGPDPARAATTTPACSTSTATSSAALRSPYVDVPTSTWFGNATGASFCIIAGHEVLLDAATCAALLDARRVRPRGGQGHGRFPWCAGRYITAYDGLDLSARRPRPTCPRPGRSGSEDEARRRPRAPSTHTRCRRGSRRPGARWPGPGPSPGRARGAPRGRKRSKSCSSSSSGATRPVVAHPRPRRRRRDRTSTAPPSAACAAALSSRLMTARAEAVGRPRSPRSARASVAKVTRAARGGARARPPRPPARRARTSSAIGGRVAAAGQLDQVAPTRPPSSSACVADVGAADAAPRSASSTPAPASRTSMLVRSDWSPGCAARARRRPPAGAAAACEACRRRASR